MKTVVHVVGARPNYMKIAPVMQALRSSPQIRQVLVNTGQHYDESLAGVFISELSLPTPDRNLGVGSGSHSVQTAKVMIGFEDVCLEEKPDLVVVVGDVNSTMAATLVAAKLLIPIAHVEAGLRSFDRTMPEEINRVVTDRLADLLLTPSPDADRNLKAEGVDAKKIHLVGNVMIDTLMKFLPVATFDRVRSRWDFAERGYAVLTLHRPSNVDDPATFNGILRAVRRVADDMPVVFPVHPRTRDRIERFDLGPLFEGITVIDPLGYLDFLALTSRARIVLTDSGGLQEESTALGIPCLTLRHNTERPITVTEGSNRIVGTDTDDIVQGYVEMMSNEGGFPRPALWDGHASERIAGVLTQFLS